MVAPAALIAVLFAATPTWAQDVSAEGGQQGGAATELSDPAGSVPPPPAPGEAVPAPPQAELEVVDGDFYVEPDPVLRLEGWLLANERRNAIARIAAGILGLVVGAASISGAVWAFTLDDPALRGTLGSLFVLEGVFTAGLGVAMLNVTTPQEDRYQRWRLAVDRGATAVDVAGFAGEFYAEAETQRFARLLAAVSGFAMAAGGAATVTLGAAMDFGSTPEGEEGRLIALTLGGTFLVTGLLVGLVGLLVKAPIEQDWERYQQGLAPLERGGRVSLSVAPALGDHFAGVALRGEM